MIFNRQTYKKEILKKKLLSRGNPSIFIDDYIDCIEEAIIEYSKEKDIFVHRGNYKEFGEWLDCHLTLEHILTEIGLEMEGMINKFSTAIEQLENSNDVLQNSYNNYLQTSNVLHNIIDETIQKMRDSRITAKTELKQALNVMKDVRKFFLDENHQEEMARLKDFVETAERFKAIIDDGTTDAICDVALRLSYKEKMNL